MTRRKYGSVNHYSGLPWQAALVLGIIAYVGIRYGLDWCLDALTSSDIQAPKHSDAKISVAWLMLCTCWLAALISFIDKRRCQSLLNARTKHGILAMDWRSFERSIIQAFQRQGYEVNDPGLSYADNGVDLVLHKDGTMILVQCKQWRTKLIDVRLVREMYGLLTHYRADAVKIIAIGHFSEDAQRFVEGKPIELISNPALRRLLQENSHQICDQSTS